MEPEKLNYNIRDFAMATFEKKEKLLISVPLDTLTDNISKTNKSIRDAILILIVCKDTKKYWIMQIKS